MAAGRRHTGYRGTYWQLVSLDDVAARGGRGGGGLSRGGGGVRRGGIAGGGSLGQNRAARGGDRRANDVRRRAADGDFGRQHPSRDEWEGSRDERFEERQERREDRQENREERREDWQEYAEDHYDDHDHGYYYGGYYYEDYDDSSGDDYYYDDGGAAFDGEIYDRLPCSPVVMSRGGTVYYVCQPTWFIRAYVDGELVYVTVPNPTGR